MPRVLRLKDEVLLKEIMVLFRALIVVTENSHHHAKQPLSKLKRQINSVTQMRKIRFWRERKETQMPKMDKVWEIQKNQSPRNGERVGGFIMVGREHVSSQLSGVR